MMVKDKYLGTKSNKFRRVPYIVEYLMKVIDCKKLDAYVDITP